MGVSVYILRGLSGRHYIGSTENLDRRLDEHRPVDEPRHFTIRGRRLADWLQRSVLTSCYRMISLRLDSENLREQAASRLTKVRPIQNRPELPIHCTPLRPPVQILRRLVWFKSYTAVRRSQSEFFGRSSRNTEIPAISAPCQSRIGSSPTCSVSSGRSPLSFNARS
jgi:hypothetical protein